MLAIAAALVVANPPIGEHYQALLEAPAEVRIGSIGLAKSLDHWVNDGLMAIFFLLVALEIKGEALEGALAFEDETTMAAVRLAVIVVSALSAAFGAVLFRCCRAAEDAEALTQAARNGLLAFAR